MLNDTGNNPQKPEAESHMIDDGRRRFSRSLLALGASTTALSAAATYSLLNARAAHAAGGYEELRAPIQTRNTERIEVLEFFWFGCPHCYAFEPAINAWDRKKPDYVDFVREAPPLNPSWEAHSRSFYAAEALEITSGFFEPMFDRIHKDRKPLRKPGDIADFVQSLDLGVSGDAFRKTMHSFTVESAMKRSMLLARKAGITGVPSVIINGKYRTGNSIAGSHQGIISAIDQTVEMERSAS